MVTAYSKLFFAKFRSHFSNLHQAYNAELLALINTPTLAIYKGRVALYPGPSQRPGYEATCGLILCNLLASCKVLSR